MSGQGKTTILLVEDETDQREALRALLVEEDCEVTEAEGEQQAKELLDGQKFDIVISDMWLESRDSGLRLPSLLKSPFHLGLHTALIIYTAYPAYRQCVEAMRLGAYDYISKLEDNAIAVLIESCKKATVEIKEWAEDRDHVYVQDNQDKLFAEYGERWIAVRGQEVICSSEDLTHLYEDLRRNFPQARPYIVHLESPSRGNA